MKLNLTIIADYLENIPVTFRQTKELYQYPLISPAIWTAESKISSDFVYLASTDLLPPQPLSDETLSLICIGEIPQAYISDHCEILCVDRSVSLAELANEVMAVFNKFSIWSTKLADAYMNNCSLHRIGEIGFEIFQNGIACWDIHICMLLRVVDPASKPETYSVSENTYLDEEQKRILYNDKEYQECLSETLPGYFPPHIFGVSTLYYNLFDEGVLIAQITIDQFYREYKPSDYSLLVPFGQYVFKTLMRHNAMRLKNTDKFDNMVKELIVFNRSYKQEYNYLLTAFGWEIQQQYQCVYIVSPKNKLTGSIVSEHSMRLYHLFDSIYVFHHQNSLLLILNLSKCSDSENQLNKLESFLTSIHFQAGVSNVFQNFAELSPYFRQAFYALETGNKVAADRSLFLFESYVLDILLENSKSELPANFFCIEKVQRLIDYDRKKEADLYKTLRVFLENDLNAARTLKILHIHRTTFLYRLKRIKEISDLDIEDFKIRLYLLILFQILD